MLIFSLLQVLRRYIAGADAILQVLRRYIAGAATLYCRCCDAILQVLRR